MCFFQTEDSYGFLIKPPFSISSKDTYVEKDDWCLHVIKMLVSNISDLVNNFCISVRHIVPSGIQITFVCNYGTFSAVGSKYYIAAEAVSVQFINLLLSRKVISLSKK